MKILIMGAGAFGTAIGGFLAKEHDIILVGREKYMEPIRKNGLKVSGVLGEFTVKNIRAESSVPKEEQELIILTTKSQDTKQAAEQMKPAVGKTAILSLQNGVGNEEVLQEIHGEDKVLGGIAMMGFEIVKPGEVKVTAVGDHMKIGEMDGKMTERIKKIAEVFTDVGIETDAVDNIKHHIWTKLMYNCALNSTSALFGVEYGKLRNEYAWKIVNDIIKEVFLVAEKKNIKLNWKDHKEMVGFLDQVLKKVGKHRASMLQDLELGRKTEIDFLNGKVVEYGKEIGIKTPVNEILWNLIKFREN
ncbi:ketopantoate reductase family protein [Candidatus Woesearchaeota archaeon]|nr:ketopantoate reductase family protein [Candidatus Woesearchaeota archaeon]